MDSRLVDLSTRDATAFYRLGLFTGGDLVTYAQSALQRGVRSDALSVLAGELHPDMDVVGPLFARTLDQLCISNPTKIGAQLTVAHFYAKAIREGHLTPYDGARKIWWDISNELDSPAPILLTFEGAASEIEDLPGRYAGEEYNPTPLTLKNTKRRLLRQLKSY